MFGGESSRLNPVHVHAYTYLMAARVPNTTIHKHGILLFSISYMYHSAEVYEIVKR